MTVSTLLKEYVWLVNTIRRAGSITFASLQDKWLQTEMSGGVELARSTFNRHKAAIEDIFGIRIACNRHKGYTYFIANAHVLREDSVQNWMISTMSVNNIIAESKALNHRIVLQQVPCDEHLNIFLEAMKRKVRVAVKYCKYQSDVVTTVDFEPYCLKFFNQRWYALAHFHRDATPEKEERDYFAIYAFDRIQSIQLTNITFEVSPEFDAKTFFAESFGVVVGDGTPVERVVLRAYGKQRYYLEDLPLHHSQMEVGHGEDWVDYAYYLRPTLDFCHHIFGMAGQVQVIRPISLAQKLCHMAQDMLNVYGSNAVEHDV